MLELFEMFQTMEVVEMLIYYIAGVLVGIWIHSDWIKVRAAEKEKEG